jgi:hypothetical protein
MKENCYLPNLDFVAVSEFLVIVMVVLSVEHISGEGPIILA